MSEYTKDQRIQRSKELERIWKEYKFDEALDDMRENYVRQWAMSQPNENKMREDLWRSVQLVEKFKTHIFTVISDGKIAKLDTKGR